MRRARARARQVHTRAGCVGELPRRARDLRVRGAARLWLLRRPAEWPEQPNRAPAAQRKQHQLRARAVAQLKYAMRHAAAFPRAVHLRDRLRQRPLESVPWQPHPARLDRARDRHDTLGLLRRRLLRMLRDSAPRYVKLEKTAARSIHRRRRRAGPPARRRAPGNGARQPAMGRRRMGQGRPRITKRHI